MNYKRPIRKYEGGGPVGIFPVAPAKENPEPETLKDVFPSTLNWKKKPEELASWAGARFRNQSAPVNMRAPLTPEKNRPVREDYTKIPEVKVYADAETTAVNDTNFGVRGKQIESSVQKLVTPRTEIKDRDLVRDYAIAQEKRERDIAEKLYKNYVPENEIETRALQKKLIDSGYDLPKYGADGKFGNETKAAYEKYLNDKSKKNDTTGLAKELTKATCDKEGCAEYVSGVLGNTVLGDAWEMKDNIEKGGGNIKYNIYDEPEIKNATNKEQLISATEAVKSRSKATKEMFQVGDVVGIFYKGSDMHDVAIQKGKGGSKNTHVGTVTAIKDGIPIISHNIHKTLHHDPYNKLTIGWVGSPDLVERTYSTERETEVKDLNSAVDVYAETLQQDLGVNIDPNIVKKDVRGILSVETGTGRVKPTKEQVNRSIQLKSILGQDPDQGKNVSQGIAKMKENTFSEKEKRFLGLDQESINNDVTSVKAATYLYLKNIKLFQDYANNNPQLGLDDDDVRSMAIMAHNQGTNRLRNLGYLSSTKTFDEEVASLRELNDSNVNDVSSTKLKYLGKKLGQLAYDLKFPEGHPSYVKRVKKYGEKKTDELFVPKGKSWTPSM